MRSRITLAVGLLHLSLLTLFGQAAEPTQLPRLRVSDNHRFLVTEDGKPFFYLADTAWELFHRLKREEAEKYLADRAGKGFNVIQAVVLAELDGLTEPNAYGHLPLVDKTDPTRPAIKDGPDNDYWDHVDEVIDLAAQQRTLHRPASHLGQVRHVALGERHRRWHLQPDECPAIRGVHRQAVQGPHQHHLDHRRGPGGTDEGVPGDLAGHGQGDRHRGLWAGRLRCRADDLPHLGAGPRLGLLP